MKETTLELAHRLSKAMCGQSTHEEMIKVFNEVCDRLYLLNYVMNLIPCLEKDVQLISKEIEELKGYCDDISN